MKPVHQFSLLINNWIEPATDFQFLMDFPRLMFKYRIYHFVFSISVGQIGHFYSVSFTHFEIKIFFISHYPICMWRHRSAVFAGWLFSVPSDNLYLFINICFNWSLVLFLYAFRSGLYSLIVEFNAWHCKCVNSLCVFFFKQIDSKLAKHKLNTWIVVHVRKQIDFSTALHSHHP